VIGALACDRAGRTGVRILTPESLAKMVENQLKPEILPDFQVPWCMGFYFNKHDTWLSCLFSYDTDGA